MEEIFVIMNLNILKNLKNLKIYIKKIIELEKIFMEFVIFII